MTLKVLQHITEEHLNRGKISPCNESVLCFLEQKTHVKPKNEDRVCDLLNRKLTGLCLAMFCLLVCKKGTALVNQGLIKRPGFIWGEQHVQEPLLSYVSNWDLSSDTKQGGAPVKSNNLLSVLLIQGSSLGLLVAACSHSQSNLCWLCDDYALCVWSLYVAQHFLTTANFPQDNNVHLIWFE